MLKNKIFSSQCLISSHKEEIKILQSTKATWYMILFLRLKNTQHLIICLLLNTLLRKRSRPRTKFRNALISTSFIQQIHYQKKEANLRSLLEQVSVTQMNILKNTLTILLLKIRAKFLPIHLIKLWWRISKKDLSFVMTLDLLRSLIYKPKIS